MTTDEAIIKIAKILCSEHYRGIFDYTNDRRDDVYRQKIEDNFYLWVPQTQSLLTLIEYKEQ